MPQLLCLCRQAMHCAYLLQAHQRKLAVLHGWELAQRVYLQDYIRP